MPDSNGASQPLPLKADIDKQMLYGNWQRTEDWKDQVHRRLVMKALDMGDEAMNVVGPTYNINYPPPAVPPPAPAQAATMTPTTQPPIAQPVAAKGTSLLMKAVVAGALAIGTGGVGLGAWALLKPLLSAPAAVAPESPATPAAPVEMIPWISTDGGKSWHQFDPKTGQPIP